MNLLECTKVNTFFEFTKQNEKIFKKKLFVFVNAPSDLILKSGMAAFSSPSPQPLLRWSIKQACYTKSVKELDTFLKKNGHF